MLFSTYRRVKKLGRELCKGSALLGAPVIIAGVCGAIGLAALIYLKKKADEGVGAGADKRFSGFTHIKHSGAKKHQGAARRGERKASYSEEDFVVYDVEETTETEKKPENKGGSDPGSVGEWIASSTSKTFHKPDCGRAVRISEANRVTLKGSKASLIKQGYKPCASCIGK